MNMKNHIRLNEINKEIENLFQERKQIQDEIQANEQKKFRNYIDKYNITSGSYIILFAKERDCYHWDIAKTVKILNINYDCQLIDVIEATYFERDYDYAVNISQKQTDFTDIHDVLVNFNIYLVNDVHVESLHKHFFTLDIDQMNFKQIESEISTSSDVVLLIEN